MIFKHISEAFNEAIDYMEKRRDGVIKSIKTPWNSFNEAGMAGIEWNTMYVIASRPSTGKTLIAQQITSNAHRLNPDQEFKVLHLQFEMLSKVMAQRELSAKLKRSLKYLNSAEKTGLDNSVLEDAKRYADLQRTREEYIVEVPLTVEGIRDVVLEFLEYYKTPTIITLDHTMLVKRLKGENTLDTMQELTSMMTEIKRKYPVIWIVLSQLNREIEKQERLEPGKVGNYPCTADVFGADFILQHADVLVAINKPSRYGIELYGPDNFIIDNKNILAFHFLKVRSGEPQISFYEAHFERMSIEEILPPAQKAKPKIKL